MNVPGRVRVLVNMETTSFLSFWSLNQLYPKKGSASFWTGSTNSAKTAPDSPVNTDSAQIQSGSGSFIGIFTSYKYIFYKIIFHQNFKGSFLYLNWRNALQSTLPTWPFKNQFRYNYFFIEILISIPWWTIKISPCWRVNSSVSGAAV